MLPQIVLKQKVNLIRVRDIFLNTSQSYTLSKTPYDSPDVFYNGLLMAEGIDYNLAGKVVTFTGQTIAPTPVIQVRYWAEE